jgi:alkylresorcinol/alkylpyrone synthase
MLDMTEQLHERFDQTTVRLKTSEQKASRTVDILSIATATPEHKITQKDALARVNRVTSAFARFSGIYTDSGIETRYSCVPADWCHKRHGWEERMAVYQHHALDLLEKVARRAASDSGLSLQDIDVLVTNSTTGIAVPSIDALLINRLKLKETVTRLPIFGFGCSGGAAGLSRAAQLAQSMPGANVLFVTIDLCSLAVRANDHSLTNFVAAALFGDGAAAVMLRSADRRVKTTSAPSLSRAPKIVVTGERLWTETEQVLGLDIKDDGFGMVLSSQLPSVMRENFGPAVTEFFARHDLSLENFDGFLIHAGGRKILEAAQDILGTSREQMAHSWSVMRDYGNMSSATVLFVLERALAAGAKGRHLLAAFGFGFSAHFAVLDL